MKPVARVLLLVVVLVLVVALAAAAFVWSRQREARLAAEQEAAQAAAVEASLKESAPPEPVPPPRPPGLDNYRQLGLALPPHLESLLRLARPGQQVAGILVAPKRETILWAHRDQEVTPIASMTKMMTLLLAMETLAQRSDLTLQSPVRISHNAAHMGGSEVWLAAGSEYTLEALLQATAVKSANDAAYAVAEAVAPQQDVAKFIVLMNRRARQLGLTQARFYNVNGLPGHSPTTENRATCRDMVVLAMALQKYDTVTNWSRIPMLRFAHNNGKVIEMHNSNRDLLLHCPGVTGLKTGFTEAAGFCVTATCEREGEPLIAVVTGFGRKEDRFAFVSKLFDWGYQQPAQAAPPPDVPPVAGPPPPP